MESIEWKSRAEALFFIEKLNIGDISKKLNISRRSISKYLNTLTDYKAENERRKKENKFKFKEYQREWDRANRHDRYGIVTGESMKHEHKLAVSILSHERYF